MKSFKKVFEKAKKLYKKAVEFFKNLLKEMAEAENPIVKDPVEPKEPVSPNTLAQVASVIDLLQSRMIEVTDYDVVVKLGRPMTDEEKDYAKGRGIKFREDPIKPTEPVVVLGRYGFVLNELNGYLVHPSLEIGKDYVFKFPTNVEMKKITVFAAMGDQITKINDQVTSRIVVPAPENGEFTVKVEGVGSVLGKVSTTVQLIN